MKKKLRYAIVNGVYPIQPKNSNVTTMGLAYRVVSQHSDLHANDLMIP